MTPEVSRTPAQIRALLAQQRRDINLRRQNAKRTLSPAQIREGIRSGQISPEMETAIGKKADGSSFTVDDLKSFQKARTDTAKRFGKKGITIDQLIAASRPDDVKRANGTFIPKKEDGWRGNLARGAARLYQVRGDTLFFSVRASEESKKQLHQVKIRLQGWNDQLTNERANEKTAVKNALDGQILIDCDCERHQFWYRYLAGVGGYALTPPTEKDFPKVRNPDLTGACCKHVVAAFQVVRTPTYQAVIANQMKRQRQHVGFSDDKKTRALTKEDQEAIKKAKPRLTDHDKYQKKQIDLRMDAAQKAIQGKLKDKAEKELAKKTAKELKARNRQLEKDAARMRKEMQRVERENEELKKAMAKAESDRKKVESQTRSKVESGINSIIRDMMAKEGISEARAREKLMERLAEMTMGGG